MQIIKPEILKAPQNWVFVAVVVVFVVTTVFHFSTVSKTVAE